MHKDTIEKSCLIIYGVAGSYKENWFPWLKKSLEEKGWNAVVPNLPDAEHPDVEIWNRELLKAAADFNENSLIVGHSMGVPAGLYLLQSLGKKIGKFIAAAPVNPRQPWEKHKINYPDLDWQAVQNFANIKLDWEKLKTLAEEIIFYYSDDDIYVPEKSVDYYKENLPDADFRLRRGAGHFNKSAGFTEFPELLAEILK
jgi:predicted alpha/beta hydrolase family esterase